MGNDTTKEEKQEQQILRKPKVGQASDLYWASRTGNVNAVTQVLANTSFQDLNHLEPNGSTALHAASFYGHADIVRLLLQERGVMRHALYAYQALTKYELVTLMIPVNRPSSRKLMTSLFPFSKHNMKR